MSDINQPCPTICSACKGKCSDQLVLPAGCVLRPTIESVEAVLTPEKVIKLWGDRSDGPPNHQIKSFARAISREVVGILARKPLTEDEIEKGRDATFSIRNPFCTCDSKTMLKAVRWAEHAHGIVPTCSAEKTREARASRPEAFRRAALASDPVRAAARRTVRHAVAAGKMVREPCFVCGAHAEAHHPAYSSPMLVTWLCRPHHRQLHNEHKAAEELRAAQGFTKE